MTPPIRWVDLLDPDAETLRQAWPEELHPSALERLLRPPGHADEPRPRLEAHGTYILGAFVLPVADAEKDLVFYQEIFLLLTHSLLMTVRKTPVGGPAFDSTSVHEACEHGHEGSLGMYAFHFIDEVAEGYLRLVDDVDAEIDDLESHVEDWPPEEIRKRLSALRHDLLRIRQTLAPTRDAVRSIVDNRLELDGRELFPRKVEVHFADVYDKLLRASEGVELSRDLVAGVRDYHQAKIANDQNEVMKRLTVIASILLVPTLIVGVYGQNLKGAPELNWSYGYWWSWFLIAAVTVAQLLLFRRKRWI